MGRPKGTPKTGGRKKGTPNKLRLSVKENISFAFEEAGGKEALVEWAKANPAEFYTKVWIKILPKELEISGNPQKPLEVNANFIADRIEQLRSAFRGVARRTGGTDISSNGTGKPLHS